MENGQATPVKIGDHGDEVSSEDTTAGDTSVSTDVNISTTPILINKSTSNHDGDGPSSPINSPASPGCYFPPVVQLDLVDVVTNEEDEVELFKKRGKLFRFVARDEGEGKEWKERAIGDLKVLQHKDDKNRIRLVMRQEKTLRIRANHYIDPVMELERHCESDKAFIWFTSHDIAEGEPRPETFAVKFKTPEDANLFREEFERCQRIISESREGNNEKIEDESEDNGDNDENNEKPDFGKEERPAASTKSKACEVEQLAERVAQEVVVCDKE